MTANKRFIIDVEETTQENALFENGKFVCFEDDTDEYLKKINELADENEQLKKGMIGVVDRYIKNVECNPPSSVRTYGKIKGALVNIREDLRSLIGDFE